MKRTNIAISLIAVIALIAGVVLMTRPSQQPASRFAPMAPDGASIQSSTLGKDGKGGDKEEVKELKHDTSAPLSSITPLKGEQNGKDADMDKTFILPGRGTTLDLNAPV